MKKQLFCSVLAIVATIGSLMAQGMEQTKAPKERAMETLSVAQAGLTLSSEQAESAYPVFISFYEAQQTAMAEMRSSGSIDRTKMKEIKDKLSADRDAKLKAIFTDDQLKKWINEIEPGLRPQQRNNEKKP